MAAYRDSRWTAPPAQLLTQRLRGALSSRGTVLEGSDGVRARRSVDLNEFEQVFDGQSQSHGAVTARATLMLDKVLGQRIVRCTRAVQYAGRGGRRRARDGERPARVADRRVGSGRTRARRDACRAAAMSATGTPASARGRPLPLTRLLIVYASLYPFAGWMSLGIGPFDSVRADAALRDRIRRGHERARLYAVRCCLPCSRCTRAGAAWRR